MKPQTALITGASSGFGFETARRFAREGWNVIAAARRQDRLTALAAEYPTIQVRTLDVTERPSLERLIEEFRETGIDLLVNNAGAALGLEKAHQAQLTDWDAMLEVNVRALYTLTRLVLPLMVERDSGLIVNVGSIAGSWPYPGGNVYGATKAFVQQFTRNLKADLLGTRVRVTCLEPGLAETEFSLTRFAGDASRADKVYEGTKPLSAQDIADAIWWIANLPPHINVTQLEVMATCQAWGPYAVSRGDAS